MRVFVYFNLHLKCLSLKALEGERKGRVIAHADGVHLTGVRFKVSQAGRNRVLREKCKNVHAGVVGDLSTFVERGAVPAEGWSVKTDEFDRDGLPVTYNPYRYDSFVSGEAATPVHQARECLLRGKHARMLA